MRVIKRVIEYKSREDEFRIYPLGDIHLGHRNCDEGLLDETIAKIRDDPFAYWGGMGDMCEFINRSDKRFDPRVQAEWITPYDVGDLATVQKDRLIEKLIPIKDKCLWLLNGTHEKAIYRRYDRDIYYEIVQALKPDPKTRLGIGISGFLHLTFRRVLEKSRGTAWTVVFYLHHGWFGGRLAGEKALNLERIFKNYDCDVGLVGHCHARQVYRGVRVYPTKSLKIRERKIVAAVTGTFLKTVSDESESYAEERGYWPQGTGMPVLIVRPDTQDLKIEV